MTALTPLPSLLMVDLETTGLDPRAPYGAILEIGLRVLSEDLNVLTGRSWVVPYSREWVNNARKHVPDAVREMHDASGLWDACVREWKNNTGTHLGLPHPFLACTQWAWDNAAEQLTLAGSSVHSDKAWLQVHVPGFLELTPHRLADVSAMRELLMRMGPGGRAVVDQRPTRDSTLAAHRVMADLDASLAELRHYRDALSPWLTETFGGEA